MLSFGRPLVTQNAKCISLDNQLCLVRPTLNGTCWYKCKKTITQHKCKEHLNEILTYVLVNVIKYEIDI